MFQNNLQEKFPKKAQKSAKKRKSATFWRKTQRFGEIWRKTQRKCNVLAKNATIWRNLAKNATIWRKTQRKATIWRKKQRFGGKCSLSCNEVHPGGVRKSVKTRYATIRTECLRMPHEAGRFRRGSGPRETGIRSICSSGTRRRGAVSGQVGPSVNFG
jgi:hypothetical protein